MKHPLANCEIAVAGQLPQSWTSSKLTDWIEVNGGELVPRVERSTTHLLCSEEQWLKPCDMVKAATTTYKHVQVVSFDWLEDSLQQRTRKRTDQYAWSSSSKSKAKPSAKPKSITSSSGSTKYKPPKSFKETTRKGKANKNSDDKKESGLETEEMEAPAPKLTDTHHIYIDANSTSYDVKMQCQSSIDGQAWLVRLQLYESKNANTKTYTCTSKYTYPDREMVVKVLAPEGSSFDAAMAVWKAIWEHKTGSAWIA